MKKVLNFASILLLALAMAVSSVAFASATSERTTIVSGAVDSETGVDWQGSYGNEGFITFSTVTWADSGNVEYEHIYSTMYDYQAYLDYTSSLIRVSRDASGKVIAYAPNGALKKGAPISSIALNYSHIATASDKATLFVPGTHVDSTAMAVTSETCDNLAINFTLSSAYDVSVYLPESIRGTISSTSPVTVYLFAGTISGLHSNIADYGTPLYTLEVVKGGSYATFGIDRGGEYTIVISGSQSVSASLGGIFVDKESLNGEPNTIFNVSDDIEDGEIINVVGYKIYDDNTKVYVRSLSNDMAYEATIVSHDTYNGEYLNCAIPTSAPNGLYKLWIVNSHGKSNEKIINAPRINFLMDNEIHAGVTVMASGRNIDPMEYGLYNVQPRLRLVNVETGAVQPAIVKSYGPYKIEIGVSEVVPVGEYYVEISVGPYEIWSRCETAQTLTVVEQKQLHDDYHLYAPKINKSWEQDIKWENVVRLTDFTPQEGIPSNETLAKQYGESNASAYNRAVNKLKEMGGGVLLIPDGDWLIASTLYLESNIAVVGESRDGTRVHFINGWTKLWHYYNVGFRANKTSATTFGLSRMTIDSYAVGANPHAVPDMFVDLSSDFLNEAFAVDLTIHTPTERYYPIVDGVQEETERRGLAMQHTTSELVPGYTYSGGKTIIKDCYMDGVRGNLHSSYTGGYLHMENNTFNYEFGAISIVTPYTYIVNNVINNHSQKYKDGNTKTNIHGFMHRGYEYYEGNYVYDCVDYHKGENGLPYANVGEALCAELAQSFGYGPVVSASNTEMVIKLTADPSLIKVDFGRLNVEIVRGKGMGQMVTVDPVDIKVNGEYATLKLRTAWSVVPDSNSIYSLQVATEGNTYYKNYVNGSTKGLLLYCDYVDCVADSNELYNSGGIAMFAYRNRTEGNYYDEDEGKWYYNYTTDKSGEYVSQGLRYNNNAFVRIEDNLCSGISPVTKVVRIAMRGEQQRTEVTGVDPNFYADLPQNFAVEIRGNTVQAGGYWGYEDKDGVIWQSDRNTDINKCEWFVEKAERGNNMGDEVSTMLNGKIAHISGIFVGSITSSSVVPNTPELNKNILIEDNTVTDAISGVFMAIYSSGVLMVNNDFSKCDVAFEMDCRKSDVVYPNSISNVVYINDDQGVTYRRAGVDTYVNKDVQTDMCTVHISKYTVTYTVNGTPYTTQSYYYGDTIKAPQYTAPSGYQFAGWEGLPATMPMQDISVEANIVDQDTTYQIVYIDEGDVYRTVSYKYGENIKSIPTPYKEGHNFLKWTPALPKTMPADNLTTYSIHALADVAIRYRVDGKIYKTVYVKPGSPAPKVDTPSKVGYTFVGWDVNLPSTIDKSYNLNAVFSANTYTVKYYDAEELVHTEYVKYGESIPAYSLLDKVDQDLEFKGWSSEIPATMPAEDIEVNSVYQPFVHTLNVIVDGEIYATFSGVTGSQIGSVSDPTKVGHTFTGWSSEIPATMPKGGMEITAIFTVNEYTLTYMVDDEIYQSSLVAYGTPLIHPTLSKTGYTFVGWQGAVDSMIAEDLTLVAIFEKTPYTITYYVDGIVYETQTYYYGDEIVPPTPVVAGYDIDGWENTVPQTMPAESLTIHARATKKSYTITFIVDGEVYHTETVLFKSDISFIDAPAKAGYVFGGWVSDYTGTTVPAMDVTYTAEYILNTHTVTYYTSEGEVFKVETYEHGQALVLPTEGPTMEGKEFIGWKGFYSGRPVTADMEIYANFKDVDGCKGAMAMLSAFMGLIALAVVGKKY